MTGVNFQPGGGTGENKPAGNTNSVQEAIKVLSLRLPKVVGAQAVASAPLLQSQGSAGGRVDSVVNSVLGRMFPTGQAPPSNMPSFGTAPESGYSGPSFGGGGGPSMGMGTPEVENPWKSTTPRIIIGDDKQRPPLVPGEGETTGGGTKDVIDQPPVPTPTPQPQQQYPYEYPSQFSI